MNINDFRVGKNKNRSIKLTPDNIRFIDAFRREGLSIKEIARRLKVTYHCVYYVLNPDKLRANKLKAKQRGTNYNPPEKNKTYVANHRAYKRQLLKNGNHANKKSNKKSD